MGTRAENKAAMSNQIYDVALELFCERGYEKTSLVDIAYESHVSTRTLYRYFPTKESILHRFARENLSAMHAYALSLPADESLKDKVLDIMVYDYQQMFGLFDMSFLLHAANDEYSGFLLSNFKLTESVYAEVLMRHMRDAGSTMEPEELEERASFVSTLLLAVYRHITDKTRFEFAARLDETIMRSRYTLYLDAIWDGLMAHLECRA